jgi:hypothetical protein
VHRAALLLLLLLLGEPMPERQTKTQAYKGAGRHGVGLIQVGWGAAGLDHLVALEDETALMTGLATLEKQGWGGLRECTKGVAAAHEHLRALRSVEQPHAGRPSCSTDTTTRWCAGSLN